MSRGISYEEQILRNKEDIEDIVNELDGKVDTIVVETIEVALDSKVDKVAGKGLSSEDYTSDEKTKLSGIEEGAEVNPYSKNQLDGFFNVKVDKVAGKGLSTEDYTTNEKTKLTGLYTKTEIDSMIGDIETALDAILGV